MVYGTGQQSRDFTYVKDVVTANFRALEAPAGHLRLILQRGPRGQDSLLELLETLQEILGTKIEPRFEPPRPGDVMHSSADVTLAQQSAGVPRGPRFAKRSGAKY